MCCIRVATDHPTYVTYIVEDGTGAIEVKMFPDQFSADNESKRPILSYVSLLNAALTHFFQSRDMGQMLR